MGRGARPRHPPGRRTPARESRASAARPRAQHAHATGSPLMRTLIEILASLAILANAVIYGTDVFGAIVLRPAIAAVDDRTLTQLLGHIHRIADRRFPAIGAAGLIAAIATAALAGASGHRVSAAAAALATLALVIFLAIYNRVSKPVNTALTAAALADRSPRYAPRSPPSDRFEAVVGLGA